MTADEFVKVAGFTETEAQAWESVRVAASACMRLARDDGVHPMESEEMASMFHHVQARLLARPTMRALRNDGEWGLQPPEVDDS